MRHKIVIVIYFKFWIWFILKQTDNWWMIDLNQHIWPENFRVYNIVLNNHLLINQIKYLSSTVEIQCQLSCGRKQVTWRFFVMWFCGLYVDMWFCGCSVLLILSLEKGEGGCEALQWLIGMFQFNKSWIYIDIHVS